MLPNGSAAHSPETPLISDVDADAEILRLAGLSVLSYGRERKDASEKLRLPVAWLDKVVNAKKAEIIASAGGDGEGGSGGGEGGAKPPSNKTVGAPPERGGVARPALLIDEADSFLAGNDELRGVLNSGHRRGGSVLRVVGEALEVREFATFSPAAIAMIGTLPGTLADRSVAISLKRKRSDEVVENFRHDRTEELDRLGRMCARWAADNINRLRGADPEVPPNLFNRAADNWRPLLAIAEAAGDDWPARAREIAARTVDADQAKRVGLLADIRDVFEAKEVEEIKSAELATALVAMEGHPWAEYGRSSKPLSANSLARMLTSDHISPVTIRFDDGLAKGYRRRQFDDAFARYLPLLPESNRNTVTNGGNPPDFGESQPLQPEACYGSEIAQDPSVSATCYGVTDEKPGEPPKSERVRFRL